MSDKIEKPDSQWKVELSPEAYEVLRKHGTERPFTGKLLDNHEQGVYVCGACGLDLFSSDTKFDSGSGWPSFYAPIKDEQVATHRDGQILRHEARGRFIAPAAAGTWATSSRTAPILRD